MNKIALRKIILLSIIAVLFCIYILQLIFANRSSVKVLTVDSGIDTIDIFTPENSGNADMLELTLYNDEWLVGIEKYRADKNLVSNMTDVLGELKLLGAVSGKDISDSRYGLSEGEAIKVEAYSKGTLVRTLLVGKNTSTGSQAYIRVDEKEAGKLKDTVYLASGALHSTFMYDINGLREKDVYTLNGISSISVKDYREEEPVSFTLKKDGDAWKLSSIIQGEEERDASFFNLDDSSVSSFSSALSSLSVTQWLPKDAPLTTKDVSVTVKGEDGEYTIDFYSGPDEDNNTLCACTAAASPFYLSTYYAERITKSLDSLLKKEDSND